MDVYILEMTSSLASSKILTVGYKQISWNIFFAVSLEILTTDGPLGSINLFKYLIINLFENF